MVKPATNCSWYLLFFIQHSSPPRSCSLTIPRARQILIFLESRACFSATSLPQRLPQLFCRKALKNHSAFYDLSHTTFPNQPVDTMAPSRFGLQGAINRWVTLASASSPAIASIDDDDISRASSKRRKRSTSSKSQLLFHQLSSVSAASAPGQHNLLDCAQSVASAPVVVGGVGATAAPHPANSRRFSASGCGGGFVGSVPVGVPLPGPVSTAPGVFYGVDYSTNSRPPSRAASVASNPSATAGTASMAGAASVVSASASASARSEPGAVGGPPPTSLFHPMCPGAPPPMPPGGVVVTEQGIAPADPMAAGAAASLSHSQAMAMPMPTPSPASIAKMMAAHNHASGVASLPGSVTSARMAGRAKSRNRVRGIKSSGASVASVASVSSSVSGRRSRGSASRKPVVMEFRDWAAAPPNAPNAPAAPAGTAAGTNMPNPANNHPTMMDISAPTPPPFLVSVPSDRAGQPPNVLQMQIPPPTANAHHHQTPPPTSLQQQPRSVGPVGPPPTPPPMGGIPLRQNGQHPAFPPGLANGHLLPPRKGMMQHINHSATPSPGPPSSSTGFAGPSTVSAGPPSVQQQQQLQPPTSMNNVADLEAKMEAALVLTCLGGASPAPPEYANVPALPAKTTHQVPQGQSNGVQRTTSSSSDDDQANPTDLAPIYSSSDGYDGSGEEEGNKSPEPTDDEDSPNDAGTSSTAAPAPRRFLKGGKRGKSTRSSSPWGNKAKNLANAALEQYQATATEATPTAPSSSTTSGSKSRFRTSLKRTNSKTRMKWQAS